VPRPWSCYLTYHPTCLHINITSDAGTLRWFLLSRFLSLGNRIASRIVDSNYLPYPGLRRRIAGRIYKLGSSSTGLSSGKECEQKDTTGLATCARLKGKQGVRRP